MIHSAIKEYIKNNEDRLVAFRRELHQYPEVSFQEYETTKRVVRELERLGVDYQKLDPTGVVAELKGGKPGKTVLLRADMDALSIHELNDHLEYVSKNEGVMHACGHDSHTSMLMMALEALLEIQEDLAGTVRFIFQPAEEIAEGADKMIEQGILEEVDNVFGIHIWTVDEPGQISCQVGPSFAAADIFKVHFKGQGGHAAQPHMTNDAIIMMTEYISNIQKIVSRIVDPLHPAVVTVGKVEAGDRFNIIAENAHIEGTVRTFDGQARDRIESKMKEFADHIAQMYGGEAEVEYNRMTEPVNNSEKSAKLVQSIAGEAFGQDKVQENPPTMGAEDFGAYMVNASGAFATVGTGNPEKESHYPHHHARFNIDEETLVVGAELYAQYAYAYLNQDDF